MLRALTVLALGTWAGGCATTGQSTITSSASSSSSSSIVHRPAPPATPPTPAPLQFVDDGAYAFVDGKTGAALSWAEVQARVRAHRFVMVGEQHDQRPHHELQRRVIAEAGKAGPGLAVGFEMFTWDKQPKLDAFETHGDLARLAVDVDWKKTWGFDFDLYAPLFAAAFEARAEVLALNAPRALVRALRQKGPEGLTPAQRAELPELDLSDGRHQRWFAGIFQGAGHPLKPEELDGFYRAQVLWDESMASRAVDAAQAGARQVIVIAGVGHIADGRGVPQRIERRMPGEQVLTVVPLTIDTLDDAPKTLADALAGAAGDILVIPFVETPIVL